MKFSVIVPVYKVEDYLRQCVESILGQNYDDFELILVDDGSPDSCPQLCDDFAQRDRRVIVVHKGNGGLSEARNFGIDAAKGDYLLFVDSDDYWNCSDVLKRIAEILENNNVEIVQFGQEKYYQLENKTTTGPKRSLSQYNGLTTATILCQLVSSGKLSISACSMAISREFVVENNLFFRKGIKTEDLEWAIRLYVCEPRWAFVDEYFYVYRMQREGSITSSIDYNHLCNYCWILENSILLVDNSDESIKYPLMSYLMYHMLIAVALVFRVKPLKDQRKELLSRLKAISKERITKYTLNKKVKLSSYLYRVGGFSIMSQALGVYLNHRGR